MNTLVRICVATALAGGLVGTAVQAQSAGAQSHLSALGYSVAEAVEVVPDQIITSWNYLDDRSVLVHRDTARHYLVTLSRPCPALQSASLISFNAAIAGLGASGSLRVGSRPGSPQCELDRIYRLDGNPHSRIE